MMVVSVSLLSGQGFPIAFAQSEVLVPNENLAADGLPPVPTSLARQIDPYTKLSAYSLASWHPVRRELWTKSLASNSSSVLRVQAPGDIPELQILIPTGIYDIYFEPHGKSLVYVKDTDGNEVFQLYAYDLAQHKSTLVSDGKSRNTEPVWSNHGDQVIYSSNRRNGSDTDLYIVNPSDLGTTHLLAQDIGYLKVFDWSPDDTQALFYNWLSANESYLYIVDVKTGQKTPLTPKIGNEKVAYDFAQFSKDGKGVYLTTDRDSEFLRLAYMNLANKKLTYLSDHIKWNIEDFKISPDRKIIAFVSNEAGVSRLHLLDTATNKDTPITAPGVGVISNLVWHADSTNLAFVFSSARAVGDIYSLNVASGKTERWVKSITGPLDVEKFSEAELINWNSFDGRQISGFLYRPPAKFPGKRPVIIDIHGGPDDQARPTFNGPDNYFISEMGIAKIYPNVRGSTGYGKSFLKLDNGIGREGAVKDIGALIDWIKTQSYLDSDRVLVMGWSYGGYMALSVAANYSDQIRAAQSVSGPTNLVTYIERTEDWRRDRRREEYGDERNSKMRAFLENIAPLNRVHQIKKPLMIVQGQNDARVRASEAEQIVQAAKKMGTPVWYLLA
ncbi:MAG TPA: prolyl oligopeptidase family serine peptidase, partial [Pyrinomonadaceae bacterium]|nr:prolyl oligopeptidase family serine peptidase [Pyrinomonadaceae bacterium]